MDSSSLQSILNTEFTSVEAFSETVKSWDIEFIQLDPGQLNARVFQLGLGQVMIGHYQFNRKFDQRGASPGGVRTFGFVNPPGVRWCGRIVKEESVLVFPRSGEYNSLSLPGFSGWTISIPDDLLNSISDSLGLPLIEEIVGGSGELVVNCDVNRVRALRTSLAEIYRSISMTQNIISRTSLLSDFNHLLPLQLLVTLSQGQKERVASSGRRLEAISRSRRLIESSGGDVTIAEVCRVSGVSWRTLDYAFKEQFNMGPKRYLEAFRLNRAHEELYRSSPEVKVADVANKWGFWHMGRFAGSYKRFFGELPSETILKSPR